MALGILLFSGVVFDAGAADFYWSGNSGTSDNIDQSDNWWTAGNPSSGDNLYFNNTASRTWVYCNYGGGSWFGNLISYTGGNAIKWRGDKTWLYKFENSDNGSLFEAEADLENRGGSDLEINPVGSGGVTVGNVNLYNSQQLKIYGDNTLTIGGNVTESGTAGSTMHLYGGATVVMNGQNTFTGDLTIDKGVVELNNTTDPLACDISLGNTSGSDDAVLQINAASVDVDSDITVETGSSGTTYIKNVNAGSAEFSGGITLDKNVTINVVSSGTLTMSGVISGTDKLITFNDSGTAVLSGANTFGGGDGTGGGGVYIQQGTLKVSADNNLGTDPTGDDANYIQLNNWGMLQATASFTLDTEKGVTLTGNGMIGVDDTYTLTYAGDIVGGNEFSKKGNGTLKLSSSAAITASQIYIDEGTLWATATQPFDGTATTINLGPNGGAGSAKLTLGSTSSSRSMDEGVTVRAGDDTKTIENGNTGGNCNFNGKINMYDDLTVNAVGGSTIVLAGGVDMSANGDNNSDLTISGANNVTISGMIEADGGAADLNFGGSGTLLLSADNASTVVNWMKVNITGGGKLQISDENNLGDAPTALYADKMNFSSSGGTVYNTADVDLISDFGITIADGVTATFEVGDGDTDDMNIAGIINDAAGSGSVVKTGPGVLELTADNTFDGGVTVNAGTLEIDADESLGTGSLTLNGGTLMPITASITLAASHGVTLGASGGTIDSASDSRHVTIDGVIDGTGSLTKESGNTLYLNGVNTYDGATIINGGTVQIATDTALGDPPSSATPGHLTLAGGKLYVYNANVTLDSDRGIALGTGGGELQVTSGEVITYGGIIAGANALTKSGAGTLLLTGANTYSGGTVVDDGYLEGDTTGLQGDIAIDATEQVTFNQSADGTYAGVLSSGGNVVKSGVGNVTFSGVNTHSGSTTISGGTLTINVAGSAANSTVTVSSGGKLAGDGPVEALLVSGSVAPGDGDDVASLVVDSALTLNTGGAYNWHLTDATGSAGTDWDVITVGGAGTINASATSGDKFTIYLYGSSPANFSTGVNGQWVIASGTLSGFSADEFAVDTSSFTPATSADDWSLEEQSGDLVLVFTAPSEPPSLDLPTATDFAVDGATLGARITSDGGSAITSRGTCWGTSASPRGNILAEGGTATGVFTDERTGMSAGTHYYYCGYAVNAQGTGYSADGEFYTFSTEPSTHVTSLTFAGNEVSASLDWDAATGANGYLVIQRDGGSAPTGTPSDGQSYSVGNTIGDGTVAAVVINGDTDASISSLTRATQYSFTVIAFNWDTANGETCNYRTVATIPSVSGYTKAANPGGDPTGLSLTCSGYAGLTSMVISWTKGTTADNTIVVVKEGGVGIGGSPVDQTAYSANTIFGSGDILNAGEYVVYSAGGTSVTVTGLDPDTTYQVELWSYNGAQAETLNYRSSSLSGSQATVAPPEAQNPTVANPTTKYLGDRSIDLHANAFQTWEGNNRHWATVFYRYDNANIGADASEGPGRDPGFAADDVYAASPAFTQVGTFYYALRISYQFGNDFYYWLDDGTAWNDMTLTQPSAAEHTIVVSALDNPTDLVATPGSSSDEIDLTWSNDSEGHWVMIVRKLSTGSWTEPVQGTGYSVNDALGDGTVIFNASGTSFTDTGLSAGTTYDYKFYSQNWSYYSAGDTAQATTRGLTDATWDGETSSAMTLAANWSTDEAPATGDDVILRFPETVTSYTPNNDFTAGSEFNSLIFDSASAYTLSGNNFDLNWKICNEDVDGGVGRGDLTIHEDTTITLSHATRGELNPIDGNIILNGDVVVSAGKELQTYGDASKYLYVYGVISGNGDLHLMDYNIVNIFSDCTYYDSYLNEGELWVGENGSAGASTRTITLGSGTSDQITKLFISDYNGGTEVDQAVVISSGDSAAVRVIGALNDTGENTFSDTITMNDEMTIDITTQRDAGYTGSQLDITGAINDGSSGYKIVKAGPGVVTLGGANTFGNLEIDQGEVWVDTAGSLTDGTTVYVGNAGATDEKAVLHISDDNGGSTINEAIEVNAGDSAYMRILGSLNTSGENVYSGTLLLKSDVGFYVSALGTLQLDSVISESGGSFDLMLTGDSNGTLELRTGAKGYTGATLINAGILDTMALIPDSSDVTIGATGELQLTGASETIGSVAGSGVIDLGAGRTLTTGNSSGTKTFSGVISEQSGAGKITYSGGNGSSIIWELTGNNTYVGVTTISQGNVAIGHNTALGTAAGETIVADGAQLRLSGGLTVAEPLTLSGDGTTASGSASGGLRSTADANEWSGAITLGADARINADASTLTVSGSIDANDNTLYVGGAGNVALSTITDCDKTTGDGGLFKDSAGTVSISGDNSTLTADVYVRNGKMSLSHASALGSSGTAYIGDNSTANNVYFTVSTGALTVPKPLNIVASGSGGIYVGNEGAGAVVFSGAVSVNRAFDLYNSGAGSFTMSGTMDLEAAERDLVVATGNSTISGRITNGSLKKSGANTLTISNTGNDYSGTTLISAGTLQLGAAGVIPDASDVTVTGTLSLNGNNETFAALSGAGSLSLGAGNLTCGDDSDTTFSGTTTGSGNITKAGSGRLTLSGASAAYTGTLNANAGTLVVNANYSGGDCSVGASGTLSGEGTVDALTIAGAISAGDGSVGDVGTFSSATATLSSGGTYSCDVTAPEGAAGTGYDQIAVSGQIDVGSGFSIAMYDSGISGWDNSQDYTWTVMAGGSVANYTEGDITLDTSNWSSGLAGGEFSLVVTATDIQVKFVSNKTVVYDHFLTASGSLSGGSGGSGWGANTWSLSSAFVNYDSGSFACSTYSEPVGNKIVMDGDADGRWITAERTFATAFTEGKVYISWIQNFQYSGNQNYAGLRIMDGVDVEAFVGKYYADVLQLAESDDDQTSTQPLSNGTGNDYVIVVCYDFGDGSLSASAYDTDNDLIAEEPSGYWDLTSTQSGIDSITGIRFSVGANGGNRIGAVYNDEIRIGTNWNEVVRYGGVEGLIPDEPSAALVFVGFGYTEGSVDTEITDAELADSDGAGKLDVAVRWTANTSEGMFVTNDNNSENISANIASGTGRVLPNWDAAVDHLGTETSLGLDLLFTNAAGAMYNYGDNGDLVVTTVVMNAFNIDADLSEVGDTYYVTVSGENGGSAGGPTISAPNGGNDVPVTRAVVVNSNLVFTVTDDDAVNPVFVANGLEIYKTSARTALDQAGDEFSIRLDELTQVNSDSEPLTFVLNAYDAYSGLQLNNEGDGTTNVNLTVANWLTANVSGFLAAESDGGTELTDIATNTWQFTSITVQQIADMYSAGASGNDITFVIRDNDHDRGGDQLSVTDSEDWKLTVTMPQSQNSGSVGTVYLGDTGVTFAADTRVMGPNNDSARVWISQTATLTDGKASAWSAGTALEAKSASSRQFTATGNWYWGIQIDSGDYGSDFWYKTSQATWGAMTDNGASASLVVDVQALVTPTDMAAVINGSDIDLTWTANPARGDVVVVYNMTNAPSAPVNGTVYAANDSVGSDGTKVIYVGSAELYTHTPSAIEGEGNCYAVYTENHGYYSATGDDAVVAKDPLWLGDGASATWDVAGNWTSPEEPPASQLAVFYRTRVNGQTITITGAKENSGLLFNNDASDALTFSGTGSLALGSDGIEVESGSGNHIFNVDLNLSASQAWSLAEDFTIGGVVNEVSGAYNLTKSGAGTLTLNGANTVDGSLTISAGKVVLGDNNALNNVGATKNTIVSSGAVLDLNGQDVPGEYVTINGTGAGAGALINDSTAATLDGPVTLASASTIGGSGDITYSGTFTGTDVVLTKAGAGKHTLLADSAATLSGKKVVNGGTLAFVTDENRLGATPGLTADQITLNGGTLELEDASNAEISANSGITLGAGGGTLSAVADTLTISSIIAGSSGGDLAKAGAGVVMLSGNNTYDGDTAVDAGTLRIGAAERIPDGSAVTATGTLDLNSNDETVGSIAGAGSVTLGSALLTAGGDGSSTAFSGVMSGSGSLTKLGAGTLTLSGDNTYEGDTTISAGTITLGADNRIDDLSDLIVASGATFNMAGYDEDINSISGVAGSSISMGAGDLRISGVEATEFAGIISGSGKLIHEGLGGSEGDLTLSGVNTYEGGTVISGGVVRVSANSNLGAATGDIWLGSWKSLDFTESFDVSAGRTLYLDDANGGHLTVEDTKTVEYPGVIAGGGQLNKNGNGKLELGGVNTYSGGTHLQGGTLAFGADRNFGAVPGGPEVYNICLTNVEWSTLLMTNDAVDYDTGITLAANRGIFMATNALFDVITNGHLTIAGSITANPNVSMSKEGNGKLTLSQRAEITGILCVNAGELELLAADPLATEWVNVGEDVEANASPAARLSLGPGVTLTNNIAIRTNVAQTTHTRTIAMFPSGSAEISGDTDLYQDLEIGVTPAECTLTFSGLIQSIVGEGVWVNKVWGGTVVFGSALNTFKHLTVSDGIAQSGVDDALWGWCDLVITNSGTYDLDTYDLQVAVLAGDGNLDLGSGTLTITNGYDRTFAGTITGAGVLKKSGDIAVGVANDMQFLTGNNDYSGGTIIDDGTLHILTEANLGTGGITFDNGARLWMAQDSSFGSSRAITLTGDGRMDVYTSMTAQFDGQVTGAGGLAIHDGGRVILTGNNNFAGAVAVNDGILRVTHGNALGTVGGDTTVADGAALEIQGGITTLAEALNINGAGDNGPGGAYGVLRNVAGNNTYAGAVELKSASSIGVDTLGETLTISGIVSDFGDLNFTKIGDGTLELTQNNTLSGGVYINQGTIEIPSIASAGNAQPLGSSDIISMGSSAESGTLLYTGGDGSTAKDVTLVANGTGVVSVSVSDTELSFVAGSQWSGSGELRKLGVGTLVLNPSDGHNTMTGPTVVGAGVLQLANDQALGDTRNVYVASGSAVELTGNATAYKMGTNVVLNGTGGGIGALRALLDSTVTSKVELASAVTIGASTDANTDLALTNLIYGAGSLTKTGPGVLDLVSETINTYVGATTIDEGAIHIRRDSSLGFPPASEQAGHLTLNGGELYKQETGAGSDYSELSATRGLTIGAAGGTVRVNSSLTFTYDGKLYGSGDMTKEGAGTLSLGGNSAGELSGGITINGGTVIMEGTVDSAVSVETGAELMGAGSLGALTVKDGGTVQPGDTVDDVAKLDCTGLDLDDGSTLTIPVTSGASATGSMIMVTGTMTLPADDEEITVNLNFIGTTTNYFRNIPIIHYSGATHGTPHTNWVVTGVPASLASFMKVEHDASGSGTYYVRGATPDCNITNGAPGVSNDLEVKLDGQTVDGLTYDLIYFDAATYPANPASHNWQKLYSVTASGDHTIFTNNLSTLASGYLRFLRISPLGAWQNEDNKFASKEVYVAKRVPLFEGRNWISLPCSPVNPTVSNVFGYNLPSGGSSLDSTTIHLYNTGPSIESTNTIWFNSAKRWQFVTPVAFADDFVLPIEQGFFVEIPEDEGTCEFGVIGALRTNNNEVVVQGPDALNFLSVELPSQSHPSNLNLVAAGFVGAKRAMLGDRLYSWDGANQRLKSRGWMWYKSTESQWYYDNNQPIADSARPINQSDAILIYTTPTTASWTWTNKIYYTPPTSTMTP